MLSLGCSTQAVEPTSRNLVVVSFDTLRRDRLGVGLTPNLDAFAEQATVYSDAIAPSHETLFSHAALFTGRYVSELGPVDYTFTLPDEHPTLAEVFGLYGYDTAAFVAGGHMDPAFGLDRGFETYESVRDWGSFFHTVPPALAWIEGREEPFFALVHGYDVHHRYLKPASEVPPGLAGEVVTRGSGTVRVVDNRYFADTRFDGLYEGHDFQPIEGGEALSEDDIAAIRGVYDDAVRYSDAWFGELMAGLEAQGRLNDTVIVVLGDHGEDLGEHGIFNHRPPLCEDVVNVPLMVRIPGKQPSRVHKTTSLVEVAPRIYATMDVKPPAGLHDEDGTVFAESAFRELLAVRGDKRLSFTGLSASNPFLVPLMRSSTTGWEGDLELKEALVAWREQMDPKTSGEMTPERRKLLQERGYWAP